MLIIQSFFQNTTNIRGNLKVAKKQANLSCKFLKKHGYNVILYTDKNSIDYFRKIKYDNIITIDQELINQNTVDRFWSNTKLLSCLLTNEPFYHIDIDFFLIENILESFKDKKFITFHQEPWIMKWFINRIPDQHILKYLNIQKHKSNIYNCAVFGGTDIITINSNIRKILNNCLQYNNQINKMISIFTEKEQSNWLKSVFIEQYYLTNSIYNEIKEYNTILNVSHGQTHKDIYSLFKKHKIFHLWIEKNRINKIIGLNNYLNMMKKYYF
jgi:hypothetical protein